MSVGSGPAQDRAFGVAIGLPEPFTTELQTWRRELGDPQADAVLPHVTLLPPTPLSEDVLPGVLGHLEQVAAAHAPFELHLRGTGTFRPVSPVVFVSLARGISACERVEAAVRSGPLARETAFPYHPHVTVAHDLDDAALDRAFDALAGYEARFPVQGFTLFERGSDGFWRPEKEFPFATLL